MDLAETLVGEKDVLPLWVADMDFQCPPAVAEAIQRRVNMGFMVILQCLILATRRLSTG
jgi:hypothetical protein